MSTYLKYQYNWAKNVVNTFVEKYARGSYNLARMMDCPAGELRHFLCMMIATGNSLKWQIVKKIIKSLQSDEYADIRHLSPPEQKALYKCLAVLATDDQLDGKEAYKVLDSLRQQVLF